MKDGSAKYGRENFAKDKKSILTVFFTSKNKPMYSAKSVAKTIAIIFIIAPILVALPFPRL